MFWTCTISHVVQHSSLCDGGSVRRSPSENNSAPLLEDKCFAAIGFGWFCQMDAGLKSLAVPLQTEVSTNLERSNVPQVVPELLQSAPAPFYIIITGYLKAADKGSILFFSVLVAGSQGCLLKAFL